MAHTAQQIDDMKGRNINELNKECLELNNKIHIFLSSSFGFLFESVQQQQKT